MPLNAAGLQASLTSLMTTHGASTLACAGLWASAFGSYASGVVPPSASVAAAQTTLQAALAAAFATPSATAAMDAAFLAAAATIGAGMAPAFTAVPPAGAIGFGLLLAPPYAPTAAAAAAKVATAIDTWMRTGSATLVAPPNTVVPAWS